MLAPRFRTISRGGNYPDPGGFGNVLRSAAPGTTLFGYAGGLYDSDTHLSHFGAREYDPETGLWTRKDPLLFGGGDTNVYAYAFGDPVDYVDPDGGFAVLAAIGIAVIVGALIFGNPAHAGEEATETDADVYGGMAVDAAVMVATPLVMGPVFKAAGRVCGAISAPAAEATGAYLAGAEGGTGLGILEGRSISVSQKGLALVEEHLSQFGDFPQNSAMLGRLQGALADGARISGADASFYLHEAAEATMMRRGLSYAVAHGNALAKYGVSPFSVYHPEVVMAFRSTFNSNWFKFWGI